MIHETKQASGKDKLHGRGADEKIDEIDEMDEIEEFEEMEEYETSAQSSFNVRVTQMKEKFAGTWLGQMMLPKADRILKVMEATAKWSLPQTSDVQLERPLPWIFFLTLIVCLRVYRCWYSVFASVMGGQTISARSMVYYFQNKRRHLRAIRIQGLKKIKSRETETCATYNTFMSNWSNRVGRAICTTARYSEEPAVVLQQDGQQAKDMSERSNKNRCDKDVSIHDLTVIELLDKFANEDSDNDSDYEPEEGEDDDYDDDSIKTSHSTTASAEETFKENEEKSAKDQDDVSESQREHKPGNEIAKDIKENGETKPSSKLEPLNDLQNECQKNVDSDNEQMHTPKEFPETNGAAECADSHEIPVVTTTVAPTNSSSTPKTTNIHLTTPHLQENNKISTPGHETAASVKPHSTQTAETGSLQDFHSVFHPAPLVKGSSAEVRTSTPNDKDEGAGSVSPDNQNQNQKKNSNHSSSHNKHHHYYHYSDKNRSKNRR